MAEQYKIKVRYNANEVGEVEGLIHSLNLNTVCAEANCPNISECSKKRTATFMILGKYCTRNCSFCNVQHNRPVPVDENEPTNVALAAKELGLRHVVVTSVTRDDLSDGGAEQFRKTILEIKRICEGATVEVLIPDFLGNTAALDTVLSASPDVLNHNVETVKELYHKVRPQAVYERSLDVLKYCKRTHPEILTKTGFMVGLGESLEQIKQLISDIKAAEVDILTIGQYLRPSKQHAELIRYATESDFLEYKRIAEEAGIKYVVSMPLARSSYKSYEALLAGRK